MTDEVPKFFPKFERTSEERVRLTLRLGLYSGEKARQAEAWLEQQAHRRASASEERKEASIEEQIKIARDASAAAWAAAREAETANTIAKIALIAAIVIPMIAIAVSIIVLFLKSGP